MLLDATYTLPAVTFTGGTITVVVIGVLGFLAKEKYVADKLLLAKFDQAKTEALAIEKIKEDNARKVTVDALQAHIKMCSEKDMIRVRMEENIKAMQSDISKMASRIEDRLSNIDINILTLTGRIGSDDAGKHSQQ